MTEQRDIRMEEDGAGLLREALDRTRAGNYTEAMELLEEARSRCPSSPTILYHLGRTHSRLGAVDRAIDCYQAAVAHDPGMVKAHVNLALLYLRQRKTSLAEQHLVEACKQDPESPEAHLNLGALYAEKGMTTEGIQHLEKATELAPCDEEAHLNLGLAYQAHGLHRKSVRALRKAAQLKPDDAELLYHLAKSLHHAGMLNEAVETCRKALERDPDLRKVYRLLGRLYDEKGMKSVAERMYHLFWERGRGSDASPPVSDETPQA